MTKAARRPGRNLPWADALLSKGNGFLFAVLPVPPSGNAAYVKGRWGIYSAKVWVEYQDAMKKVQQRFRHIKKIAKPTEIKLVIRWYRHIKAGDVTNREKTVEDALQGILYDNDSQVKRKETERFDTFDGWPRIEVEVHRLRDGRGTGDVGGSVAAGTTASHRRLGHGHDDPIGVLRQAEPERGDALVALYVTHGFKDHSGTSTSGV